MKKILSLVLVLIFALSLCGCGAVSTTPKEKITQDQAIAIALDSAKLAIKDVTKEGFLLLETSDNKSITCDLKELRFIH